MTVGTLACWMTLRFLDFDLRVSAALAFAAQFLTLSLLAEGRDASIWRRAAIAVFVLGGVFFGWSWLTPFVNATWLNRSVILMLTTFGLTELYALLLDKARTRFPDWTNAARACVPFLLGAGVVALFFCLGTEVCYQLDFRRRAHSSAHARRDWRSAHRISDHLRALRCVAEPRSIGSLGARSHAIRLRRRDDAGAAVPARAFDDAVVVHRFYRALLAARRDVDRILRCGDE